VALRSSRGEHRSPLFLARIFALRPRPEALATRISVAKSFSGLWRVNHNRILRIGVTRKHDDEEGASALLVARLTVNNVTKVSARRKAMQIRDSGSFHPRLSGPVSSHLGSDIAERSATRDAIARGRACDRAILLFLGCC